MAYNDASRSTGEPDQNPKLNFEIYAEQLCRKAIKKTDGTQEAFTVGIFGSWGSGKTTLMRRIENKFEDENFLNEFNLTKSRPKSKPKSDSETKNICRTIWFNPWKYDGKEDVRNALIQTILREIINDSSDEIVLQKCKRLAANFALCTGGILGQIAKVGVYGATQTIGGILVDPIAKEIEDFILKNIKSGDDPYLFINKFEEGFRDAVQKYVGNKGRLIVFIDDLDRCLPENALTVLESLKLYLTQVNCIFFIGLDKRIIEQAVSHRYENIRVTGKEYIEKIIRLNFFLFDKDPDVVAKLFELAGISQIYDRQSSHTKETAEKMWTMVLQATQGNLRKIEQFTIAFELIEDIVKALNNKIQEKMKGETQEKQREMKEQLINWDEVHPKLAKVLAVQMNFPDFYDAWENNHALMEEINTAYKAAIETSDKLRYVQEKYSSADRNLIEFIVNNFEFGKICNDDDWKVIHKLSKAVSY